MRLPRDYILHIESARNGVQLTAEWQGELVRCKDCKYLYNDADTGKACEFTNMGMKADDFCSYGERSE